ncbi:MAG: RNA 2'-phosphotransferase, partial [Bacteroidota bacterium]
MIKTKSSTKLSKFISLVLRHRPEVINLELDENGWANTPELIEKMTNYGKRINVDALRQIVENCPKQRFAFSEDGTKIRANQ